MVQSYLERYISCYVTSAIFPLTVVKCRRTPPLGPMPNADIDLSNPESLERYRSYGRYLRKAEEAKKQPVWWKTYKGYMEQADPDHGEAEEEAVASGFHRNRCILIHTPPPSPLAAGAEHVDIGLPHQRPRRTVEVRERRQLMKEKKKDAQLEQSLRLRTCMKVSNESSVLQ